MISSIMNPAIGNDAVRTLQKTLDHDKGANSDFSQFLEKAIDSVDQRQHAADGQILNVATGKDVDIHGQMIALEEANISLHAMASVRDKVVDAYHTIWNLQV
jgi:flagellar hook-basal body complex protein FliE